MLAIAGASIVPTIPFAADGPLENAAELRGAIALIARGGVTFVEKAQRVCAAGAAGVVFVNHDDSPYVPLGTDGAEAINIPSVCVGKRDGDAILSMLETDGELTISLVHVDAKEEPRRTDWFGTFSEEQLCRRNPPVCGSIFDTSIRSPE